MTRNHPHARQAAPCPSGPPDWASVRADFPLLTREVHGKPLVYLDSANTGQKPAAVIEAVDVNQTGELEYYSSRLEESASTLAQRMDDQNKQVDEAQAQPGSTELELTADSIVDLVLRQPYEVDETFEVAPTEWAILTCANGDRSLRVISEQSKMPISQVVAVTTALVERGLIRMGKENRRRL